MSLSPSKKASQSDGFVNIVARVLSTKNDVIVKRDGSGQLNVVRGRLADETGSIGMLSWSEFDHEPGTLLKIEGRQSEDSEILLK